MKIRQKKRKRQKIKKLKEKYLKTKSMTEKEKILGKIKKISPFSQIEEVKTKKET